MLPRLKGLHQLAAKIEIDRGVAAGIWMAPRRALDWREPLRGELGDGQTRAFSAVLCALGSRILYAYVNALTMWLTFATFVGYAVVYTLILKPLTPADLRARYNFPPGNGASSVIAIAEFGAQDLDGTMVVPAWIPSDITDFCTAHGATPAPTVRVESVNVTPMTHQ